MDVLAFLTLVVKLIDLAMAAGQEIAPFVAAAKTVISRGTDPTPADWDNLHTLEKTLMDQLDAAAAQQDSAATAAPVADPASHA